MANETVRLNVMDNLTNQDQLNVNPKDNNKIYTIWDFPIYSRQECMANQDQLNVGPKDNDKIYTIWDFPIYSRQECNPLLKRFVRWVRE
ncbi:MAG: hypothetical protein AB7Y74_00780 [Syntrophorhabdus sp.]